MLTQEELMEVVSNTIHPEIDYSLLDLGMIKDVRVQQGTIHVTINLPFPEVPIKDHLVQMVKNAIAKKDEDAEVEVTFATMNEAEREEFRRKAAEKWKC